MSTNMNAEPEAAESSQNLGSRMAKKLSKRFSRGSSSSKESAGKETAGQNSIGQQAVNKGETVKDEISKENLDSVKNAAGKGENTKDAVSQGDITKATAGFGLNKDNVNKESIEKVGQRLFGSNAKTSHNEDVRKGPVGPIVEDQRDTSQDLAGAGGSSSKATAGKQSSSGTATGLTSGAGAGAGAAAGTAASGNATQDPINEELNEQSHISSDVFSEGAAGAAGLRGTKQMKSAKTQENKNKTKQKSSQTAKQAGMGQKATKNDQKSKDLSNQQGIGMGSSGAGARQNIDRSDLDKNTSATKNTAGVTAIPATRAVRNLGTSSHKITVLQEKVQAVSQKCKTQMGVSASEISQRSPTVDVFFDAIAAERLRWMPRDGSRLDCCLRWASRLAYAVDALRESIGAFAPGANEAAKLIWGFSILLLEVS